MLSEIQDCPGENCVFEGSISFMLSYNGDSQRIRLVHIIQGGLSRCDIFETKCLLLSPAYIIISIK